VGLSPHAAHPITDFGLWARPIVQFLKQMCSIFFPFFLFLFSSDFEFCSDFEMCNRINRPSLKSLGFAASCGNPRFERVQKPSPVSAADRARRVLQLQKSGLWAGPVWSSYFFFIFFPFSSLFFFFFLFCFFFILL
jgi:hypothetical protein